MIKTLPPKIPLNLVHDADYDQCEAYITEIVEFSLVPLKKRLQGQVSAHLVISYGKKVADPVLYTL